MFKTLQGTGDWDFLIDNPWFVTREPLSRVMIRISN